VFIYGATTFSNGQDANHEQVVDTDSVLGDARHWISESNI
jgi:hypothetical protein